MKRKRLDALVLVAGFIALAYIFGMVMRGDSDDLSDTKEWMEKNGIVIQKEYEPRISKGR